jgi:S-adenosylmethionine decarboxylase
MIDPWSNPGGRPYRFGSVSGESWFLYTSNPRRTKPVDLSKSFGGSIKSNPRGSDQTLEILMTNLDPKIMKIFTKEASSSGLEATLVRNSYFSNFNTSYVIEY